ncbi:type III pantothenate kinase [Terriglobus aquaticus]|uniref:Type III pantothenate kinase n=1 Tax=Terriglobus aquaticus TaxID=940139 RepID=A0ABW9KMA7_9BACT|nr:type III pantothenate kinase [Terriglobus aquaticus]
MLLAIEVGNTNMVLGLYALATEAEPAKLLHSWRIATPLTHTPDELRIAFHSLFALNGVDIQGISGVAVSSVVPPVDSLLREVVESFFHVRPLFVEPGVKTGLPVLTDNPAEVGADRIVNSVAAFDRYGGPCIVVDLGTATTFDVVSARGEFLGGAIAPGLGISANALFDKAAKLARVNIRKPGKVVGTSTVDNIQVGLYYGYIGLVDGICERMITELGPETKVIATGGFARMLSPDSKYLTTVDPTLTLDGVRLIYERNQDRIKRRSTRSEAQPATTV